MWAQVSKMCGKCTQHDHLQNQKVCFSPFFNISSTLQYIPYIIQIIPKYVIGYRWCSIVEKLLKSIFIIPNTADYVAFVQNFDTYFVQNITQSN